jgi:hypothetical protein
MLQRFVANTEGDADLILRLGLRHIRALSQQPRQLILDLGHLRKRS